MNQEQKIQAILQSGSYARVMKKATLAISPTQSVEIDTHYIAEETFTLEGEWVRRVYQYDTNLVVVDMQITTNVPEDD